MLIGDGWSNELWGVWTGQLLLEYQYEITGKEILKSPLGDMECFIVESTATSTIGVTTLKSFYSETYGFVRLEYVLWTGIKVNLWMVEFMKNKEFNDTRTFFKTKEYIKQ